ncbi:MAG: aldo/keto reductase [Rhodanobacter sp.]
MNRVVDALDAIAVANGRSIRQIALNWRLRRSKVSNVLTGARNEQQLRDNLGAVGWALEPDQLEQLNTASAAMPPYPYYPYWTGMFGERHPTPVPFTVPTELPA